MLTCCLRVCFEVVYVCLGECWFAFALWLLVNDCVGFDWFCYFGLNVLGFRSIVDWFSVVIYALFDCNLLVFGFVDF